MSKSGLEVHHAKFLKHPQHTSVLRFHRTRHRNRFGLVSLVLAGWVVWWLVVPEVWVVMVWVSWLFLPIWLIKGRDYIMALKRERDVKKVWRDDPDWALKQLGHYHATQIEAEQEQRQVRRTSALNTALSLCGFTVVFAISIPFAWAGPQQAWVVFADWFLVAACLILAFLTVRYGSEHGALKAQLKRNELERKVLRQSSGELPEGTLNLGALSVSVEDDEARGAVSVAFTHEDGACDV